MKILYSFLFLIVIQTLSFGQSFNIYDVNSDNYPLIKAKFYVTDFDDTQIKSLLPEDFTIFENQIKRSVRKIECDDQPVFNKISTVLTIDVSGSMKKDGRLDWAKAAGKQWIEQMDSTKEETAITTFDDEALLYSDFKFAKQLLLNTLETIEIRNGTNYKNAFLDPYAGALDVARRARFKPVIIFLTDGVGLTDFNPKDIVARAKQLDAIIYAISIDISLPEEMRAVSEATGGQYFENIDSQEKLEEVYSTIRKVAINTSPCAISWYTEGCIVGRTADFNYLPLSLSKSVSYSAPGENFPEFEYITDAFKDFECSKPGDYIYKLKAKYGDISVNGISKVDGNNSCSDFTVSILNKATPFILEQDSILEIKINYNPTNSNYKFCQFKVEASSCFNTELYATGSCLDSPPTSVFLKVNRPNGGEVFKANTFEKVIWSGASKTSNLFVEYSLDSGRSWSFISNGSLSNSEDWNVPNVESDNCLIRVKQLSNNAGRKIYDVNIDSSNVLAISWNKRGNLFAIVTDTNSIKLYNSTTAIKANEVFIPTDKSRIIDVTFLPDGARLYISNQNGLYLFNLLNNQFEFIDSLSGKLEISKDEEVMSVTNSDSVVIFDMNSRKIVNTFYKSNPNSFITDASISNDSKQIAIAESADNAINSIRIYKKSTNWVVTTLQILEDNSLEFSYSNLDWSFDDKHIYSTSWVKTIQFLDLWDVQTNKKLIRKINPSNSKISDLSASPIENFLVQVDKGFQVIVWKTELVDNKLEFVEKYNFQSPVISNNTIEWSPDATRFAVGTSGSKTENLLAVYSVKSYPEVEDISDSVFSIIKIVFDVNAINLGFELLGQTKDTTFSDLLSYKYDYEFKIDSVTITGLDKSAFSLSNSPNLPTKANFNSQPDFNFNFTPYKVGDHNANLNIYSQYGLKTVKIFGKGIRPNLEVQNYNFGEVLVTKDSTISKNSIVNNGNTIISIKSIKIVGPSDRLFDLIDNSDNVITVLSNIQLLSNEKLTLKVRFSPLIPEIVNARIQVEYINELGIIDYKYIKLFGEGINPKLEVTENISFKSTKCTEISTEEITLFNKGNGRLTISKIILNSLNFKLLDTFPDDIVIEENDSLKFRVEFSPLDDGIIKDSILIFSNQIGSLTKTIYLNARKLTTSFIIEGNNRLLGVQNNTPINGSFKIINDGKTDLEWNAPYLSNDGKIEILSINPNPTIQGDTSIVEFKFNGGDKGEKFEYSFAPLPICSDSVKVEIEVKNTNPTLSTNFETIYTLVCEDTLIIKIPITNIGEEALIISNIRFENQDFSNFTTSKKNLKLLESESDTILVSFIANGNRIYESDFVIISNDSKSQQGKYSQRIIVKKEISSFNIIENNLDFIFIGLNNPGNQKFEIENTGTIPIRWKFLSLPNFSIVSVIPAIATPGEKSEVTLLYTGPNDISSNEMLFLTDSCGNLDSILLNVVASNTANATIVLGKEKRKIGEKFSYPITIKNATKLKDAGVTSITGELIFNHSLMIPTESNNTIVNQNRIVPFELLDLESGSLINIEMEALWGDDSCSVISISNLKANGNTTKIDLIQEIGEICISDLCYEGGVRLIDLSFELGAYVQISKNQVNTLEISLNLIENGATKISIIDMRGKIVKPIENQIYGSGYNSFTTDISGISDGIYFVRVETPSITITKKLIIIR